MSIPLTEVAVGLNVDVDPRTWPGINKPGGSARIVKVHYDGEVPTKVDVKYHVGGGEKEVELTYVKKHTELERRARSRRVDIKMNVDTLGGKPTQKKKGVKQKQTKKRKALRDMTPVKNSKSAKRPSEPTEGSSDGRSVDVSARIAATTGSNIIAAAGEWSIIQDGKITDYVNTLTKGRRIAYWWSVEDSWLEGTICKSLSKITTPSTIKWTIRVDFDNGDVHTLAFHPNEKRWKAFYPCTGYFSDRDEKIIMTVAKKPAPNKLDVPNEESKAATREKTKMARKPNDAKSTKTRAMKISSKPLHPDMKISFGPELSYKLKHTKKLSAKTSFSDDAIDKSMSSKSFAKKVSTKALTASSPTKMAASRDTRKSEDPSESMLLHPHQLKAQINREEGSLQYAATMNVTGPSVIQGLYKRERDKADKFVDYMVPKIASSPSSDGDGDLELKLNHGRMQLFNSFLNEVMFKKNLDTMGIQDILIKVNAYQESEALIKISEPSESDRNNNMKPFSMLEIKSFLQKLHESNRLFMVEDEGKIYAL